MVKIEYSVLYNNGHEDIIYSQATEEKHDRIAEIINCTFKEDKPGIVTLGDGKVEGNYIRLSDVSRIKVRIIDSLE